MGGFQVTWRGPQATRAARDAASRGLMLAANHVLGEARKQAPVREGTLRASGAVTEVSSTRAAISFNTPYAARQHEEVGWRHPKGGKAKYLEDPLRDERQTVAAIVTAAMRRGLGS